MPVLPVVTFTNHFRAPGLLPGLWLAGLFIIGCDQSVAEPGSASARLTSEEEVSQQTLRFLEDKVQKDPEDFVAQNKLTGHYLQRVRETSDLAYLKLAARAARASLASLPPERNIGGLAALAQVEFTSHEFVSARDHARRLVELDPDKAYPYQILSDALLELGDYAEADMAFEKMTALGGIQGITRVAIDQRMARFAALHGDMDSSRRHLSDALRQARALPAPPRETVAWCQWQLGETAFAIGDYAGAERHYRDSLATFPNYFRSVASLGRVLAARGDLNGAIAEYEHAVRIVPDPSFVAALGDLYSVAGKTPQANARYEFVEVIATLEGLNDSLYNRQQALFCADHDIKSRQAYQNAVREYKVRRDIYGADAVAWTALKAGELVEAQAAIRQALRLGTQDARLFYHAGMIAHASGENQAAVRYLHRALTLSPQFDPVQARVAKQTLSEIEAATPPDH